MALLGRFSQACYCLAFAALMLSPIPAHAEEPNDTVLERHVKAAFIYKFTNYVNWPADALALPDTPFVIAVMDDDALAEDLRTVTAGHAVNGHPIEVRKFKDVEPSTAIHLLYVGANSPDRINNVVSKLQFQPVLIVTDTEGSLTRGSVINFVLIDGHLKFEIAMDTAQKRGLKLSSSLLAVAQNVRIKTQ